MPPLEASTSARNSRIPRCPPARRISSKSIVPRPSRCHRSSTTSATSAMVGLSVGSTRFPAAWDSRAGAWSEARRARLPHPRRRQVRPAGLHLRGRPLQSLRQKHGHKNPEGAHAGDLPNLTVGPDGTGSIDVTAAGVTLTAGRASLLQPGGASLIIHLDPDDEKTDPAGNSGARIVCGVITH